MTNNDFASAQSTSFEKIPIIYIDAKPSRLDFFVKNKTLPQ